MKEIITILKADTPRDIVLAKIQDILDLKAQDGVQVCLAKTQSHLKMARSILSFVAWAFLMCDIKVDEDYGVPESDPSYWNLPNLSLQEQIGRCFPRNGAIQDQISLEKNFRLYDMTRISKIAIRWTNNLCDHLLVEDPAYDGKPFRLHMFTHRKLLEYHEKSPVGIFPDGFILETQRTLDLLLPWEHKKTRYWYQKSAWDKGLDNTACQNGNRLTSRARSIDNFHFWRDRLTILKMTYDELEPDSVTHFWRDKRRPVQWATFWVAVLVLILTVFFGTVQCIEGAIQVYKAYHPS